LVAAVSLVLMPRVFAHAHLASLETFLNLTYSATVLAVAHWWRVEPDEAHKTRRWNWAIPALTGVLFGLTLLSKMQAILIPPVVGLWALWHWRVRAIKPLAIFGLVGLIVFFVGWPWLWLDPAKHLREYFARTTGRAVLNCYYLGRVWPDKDVPWHYPFVMFAVTVPVGLQLLGLIGAVGKSVRGATAGNSAIDPRSRFGLQGPREQLLLAAVVFPLVLFALPGVAVYDGERLFLVSYPLWAVLIGRGADMAMNHLRQRADSGRWRFAASRRARAALLAVGLLTQSVGVIAMHPCQLSYYNLLVGGCRGADWLGFERTYWGDSVTRGFLRDVANSVPEGETIAVAPVLHQFQLDDLRAQSPILRAHGIQLVAKAGQRHAGKPRLYFCRKADLLPNEVTLDFDPVFNKRPQVGWPCWRSVLRPVPKP
jgi:4-amino-4-deoxy-L-arabinose transferase-like glycosyltransferase